MKIWVNTIVHNEENFVWYAVMSVVDFVDKVIIWDTGSTDKTVEIVREMVNLKGDKIEFKEVGSVSKHDISTVRQRMLDESKCDWILIVDGDEIWSGESIKKVVNLINEQGTKIEGIVVPFYNLVGDVFHYQAENAGRYNILGKRGHLQVRAINRHIKGLHVTGVYPLEAYLDKNLRPIQNSDKLVFLNAPYLHATHLQRSGRQRKYRKYKYDLGIKFPKNYHFPEVFYKITSPLVKSPWSRRDLLFILISAFRFPLVCIRRRLML